MVPPEQLEKRRRHAIRLLKKGKTLSAVAKFIGCSVSSVFLWAQVVRRKGLEGLSAKPIPGRPPKLTPAQQKRLTRLLLKGPLALGYSTDLWTTRRVAEVIWQQFHVRYHPNHVWRLLTGLGWSCQKPETRARERDEAAIEHWKRYQWPYIKNRRKAWGPSRLPR